MCRPERLGRFFVQVERGYQVGKSIREMVIFAPQNLIMDPPFTKLDILSCRNLLIYLTPELQKKLLPLFHYSLNPGGFLFLGNAETIGNFTDLFAPLEGKVAALPAARVGPAGGAGRVSRLVCLRPYRTRRRRHCKPAANLQSLADQLLLQCYSPAAVLVNNKGDILYISGRTGKYLEPAAGKANWNIFAMAREGLRHELTGALQKALRQKGAVTLRNVVVRTNGGTQAVDLTVQPLEEPEALRGMVMIVFTDVATPPETKPAGKTQRGPARNAQVAELERDTRASPPGVAYHPRRDADVPGRTQIHQRGTAVHQRGTPVHQRGTDHLQGRDAVHERGAADAQQRVAGQGGRSVSDEQRPEEPVGQHGHRHLVSGQRAPRAAVHVARRRRSPN